MNTSLKMSVNVYIPLKEQITFRIIPLKNMLRNLHSHREPCFRGFTVLKGCITAIVNEKS